VLARGGVVVPSLAGVTGCDAAGIVGVGVPSFPFCTCAVVLWEVGAARRLVVVGLGSCSGLAAGVLAGFERALVLGRAVAGLACSVASGNSDVSLMKKTPFYQMMRHKWRWNLSSQP